LSNIEPSLNQENAIQPGQPSDQGQVSNPATTTVQNVVPANPVPPQTQPPSTPTSPNGAGKHKKIFILLLIFGLVVLIVGGFFTVRYFLKKSSQKATETLQNIANDNSNKDLSWPADLPTATGRLQYSKGEITKVSQNTATGAKAIIEMKTSDEVNVVNTAYLLLISENRWNLIRNETTPDGKTATIDFETSDFSADIEIDKSEIVGEGTNIIITIFTK
jgi:hypothetical protein